MAVREFTKSERKTLLELASEAYASELDLALRDLDSGFSDWRKNYIDGFQLADLIHDFNQGPSRDLYSQYTRLDPGFLVPRAVARGLLQETEVPAELLSALQPLIEYCREAAEEQE